MSYVLIERRGDPDSRKNPQCVNDEILDLSIPSAEHLYDLRRESDSHGNDRGKHIVDNRPGLILKIQKN